MCISEGSPLDVAALQPESPHHCSSITVYRCRIMRRLPADSSVINSTTGISTRARGTFCGHRDPRRWWLRDLRSLLLELFEQFRVVLKHLLLRGVEVQGMRYILPRRQRANDTRGEGCLRATQATTTTMWSHAFEMVLKRLLKTLTAPSSCPGSYFWAPLPMLLLLLLLLQTRRGCRVERLISQARTKIPQPVMFADRHGNRFATASTTSTALTALPWSMLQVCTCLFKPTRRLHRWGRCEGRVGMLKQGRGRWGRRWRRRRWGWGRRVLILRRLVAHPTTTVWVARARLPWMSYGWNRRVGVALASAGETHGAGVRARGHHFRTRRHRRGRWWRATADMMLRCS